MKYLRSEGNLLASIPNSLEIEFDANPIRTSRFRKFEKWFDKAKFDNFCRIIGLRRDGVLRLVLVA